VRFDKRDIWYIDVFFEETVGVFSVAAFFYFRGRIMMARFASRVVRFRGDEDGPMAVEYAVMLALIMSCASPPLRPSD
jgi:hypothetical protein